MKVIQDCLIQAGLVLVILLFPNSYSLAQCACEPEPTVSNHFQRSAHVFVGRVVSTQFASNNTGGSKADLVIRFEVKEAWKNDTPKIVNVVEFAGSTEGFEPGSEWLVYAVKGPDSELHLVRDCCSRTKPWKVAKKQGDLRALAKKGEKPKRIL